MSSIPWYMQISIDSAIYRIYESLLRVFMMINVAVKVRSLFCVIPISLHIKLRLNILPRRNVLKRMFLLVYIMGLNNMPEKESL